MDVNYSYKDHAFQGYIGVSQIDITPPVGIYSRNWGASNHDVSVGNDNSLYAICVTLSASIDSIPMVLVSLDAGVWRSHTVKTEIQNLILNNFSLPKENLILCLTHTHAGPILSNELDGKSGAAINKDYIVFLQNQLNSVITNSLINRSVSILNWKYGKCSLAKNRDLFYEEEGRYVTGYNPNDDADDTLLVGRITDLNSNLIKGVIVNYACHPTTLAWQNKLISADFVGDMRELLYEKLSCPTLFIQGASGELAPQLQYTDDLAISKLNGEVLGYSVLATLTQMLPVKNEMYFEKVVPSGADLAKWNLREANISTILKAKLEYVEYNLKKLPTLEYIEKQLKSEDVNRVEKEKLFRIKNIRVQFGNGDKARIGLWVILIGDGIFIGQQNEAYSIFQQTIREKFKSKSILVGNIVNGSAGYLPPQDLYDFDCYTVNQTPFACGSLEKLILSTEEIINKLM